MRCVRWIIRGATALCLSPNPAGNFSALAAIACGAILTETTTADAGDNSAAREAQKQLQAQQRAQRQAEAELKKQMQAAAKAQANEARRQAKEAEAIAKAARKQEAEAAKAAAIQARQEQQAAAAKVREDQKAAAARARQEQQAAAAKAREDQKAAAAKAREDQKAAAAKAREEQQAAAAKARQEQQAAADQRRREQQAAADAQRQKAQERQASAGPGNGSQRNASGWPQQSSTSGTQTSQRTTAEAAVQPSDKASTATDASNTRTQWQPASGGTDTPSARVETTTADSRRDNYGDNSRWQRGPYGFDKGDGNDQRQGGWRQHAREPDPTPDDDTTSTPAGTDTAAGGSGKSPTDASPTGTDTASVDPSPPKTAGGDSQRDDGDERFNFTGERSSLGGGDLADDKDRPLTGKSWTASVRDADGRRADTKSSGPADRDSGAATSGDRDDSSTTADSDGDDSSDTSDGGKGTATANDDGPKFRGGAKKKSARTSTADNGSSSKASTDGSKTDASMSDDSKTASSSSGGSASTTPTPIPDTGTTDTPSGTVEVVGIDPSPATVTAAKKQGFVEVSSEALPSGKTVRRFRAPSGMDSSRLSEVLTQQTDLAGLAPNQTYWIYAQSGEGDGTPPPADPGKGKCTGSQCFGPTMIHWTKGLNNCARKARIGIIDTPFDATHPALVGRKIGEGDFLGSTEPSRYDWHGTAVLALLAGNPDSRTPGLVPNADFFFAKAFRTDEHGNASSDTSKLVNALSWLEAMHVQYVNMSFSGPKDSLVASIIKRMSKKGIVFIAAAGNQGPTAPPSYPAAYPQVIAVTAVTRELDSYRHANRGTYVDVAAPGVQIWTAMPNGGQGYQTGTSFAAPFVTAVLAARKDLRSVRLQKDTLFKRVTLKDLGPPGPDPIFGRGLLVAADTCTGEPEVVDRLRMLPPHMAVGAMSAALAKTSW